MAYRPALTVKVEALGGVFYFGAADQAMARIAEIVMDIGSFDTGNVPAEMIEPLCALAVQGIKDWEGVEDERGRQVSCTEATKAAIPTMDKVQIATAYLLAMQTLEEKKGSADEQPTSSSEPAGLAEVDAVG